MVSSAIEFQIFQNGMQFDTKILLKFFFGVYSFIYFIQMETKTREPNCMHINEHVLAVLPERMLIPKCNKNTYRQMVKRNFLLVWTWLAYKRSNHKLRLNWFTTNNNIKKVENWPKKKYIWTFEHLIESLWIVLTVHVTKHALQKYTISIHRFVLFGFVLFEQGNIRNATQL